MLHPSLNVGRRKTKVEQFRGRAQSKESWLSAKQLESVEGWVFFADNVIIVLVASIPLTFDRLPLGRLESN